VSASATSNPLLQTRTASLEELRELVAAGRLYAVIDACDTPAVPEKARELGETRALSLYRGTADEQYWAFAPYLFVVDGELLDWIVAGLWTEPWGIFAVADGDLEAVRRHFRRFLLVEAPDGDQWYFRFYDPRVLPTFLQQSAAEEIAELFGGLAALVVPRSSSLAAEFITSRQTGVAPSRIRIRLHRPD
jgi:Domain of unknown function (DUF4123)